MLGDMCLVLDAIYRALGAECFVMGAGCWVLGTGWLVLDVGC